MSKFIEGGARNRPEIQPMSLDIAQTLYDKVHSYPSIIEKSPETNKIFRRSVYFPGDITLEIEFNGSWTDMGIYAKNPLFELLALMPLRVKDRVVRKAFRPQVLDWKEFFYDPRVIDKAAILNWLIQTCAHNSPSLLATEVNYRRVLQRNSDALFGEIQTTELLTGPPKPRLQIVRPVRILSFTKSPK